MTHTRVNPPPHLRRPTQQLTRELDDYLRQLETIVFQLRERTGGSTDAVADSAVLRYARSQPGIDAADMKKFDFVRQPQSPQRESVIDLIMRAASSEVQPLQTVRTATSTTTTGTQVVECINAATITVTLNATPGDAEMVVIMRRSGPVRVSGSINGRTSWQIPKKYDTAVLLYNAVSGSWGVI